MTRFRGIILSAVLAAVPSAWAQTRPCPSTPDEAARIATADEEFTDADALSWAACPVAAARLFSMIFIGDAEPTPEMLDAVIRALDDPSQVVKGQAVVAAYQLRDAIIPKLEGQIGDTAPSSRLGLVQGDIALAALEALDPKREPGWPLLLRNQGYPKIEDAERASMAQFYEALTVERSESNAKALVAAAATSPYPAEVFDQALLASQSPDAGAALYREAALTAWRRLIAEHPAAVAARLRSMVLPAIGISNGAEEFGIGKTEDIALGILGVDGILKQVASSTDFQLLRFLIPFSVSKNWTATQQAQIGVRHSQLVIEMLDSGNATIAFNNHYYAKYNFDEPPDLDAEAVASALFAGMNRTLLKSKDMALGLKSITGLKDVLKVRAAAGGRDGDIASALLQCAGPEFYASGQREGMDQGACFRALLIADGRRPEEAFNESIQTGEICLAVALAGGDTQNGAAALWKLRKQLKSRESLGPIPAPAIDHIACEKLPLDWLVDAALEALDPDGLSAVRQAEMAEPKAEATELKNDWLEFSEWNTACSPGGFPLASDKSGSPMAGMSELLGIARCFDSESAVRAKEEFVFATDRLSARWKTVVPQQLSYWEPELVPHPWEPYRPEERQFEYGPGGLPVIAAMPKPRLETALDLSKLGGRDQTLESLKGKIEDGLRRASPGYDTGLFSDGKDGIILLARRERIQANGEPFDEDRRFTELGNPKASWTDMFGSIIKEKPGQFRVLAFVIAKDVTFDSSADPLNLPLAAIGEVRRLPPALANSKVGNRNVTVLVYVFERPKGKSVRARAPQSPNAYEHLVKSGVWSALGFSD